MNNSKIIIAVPKGRILNDCGPMFENAGIIPEADFFDESSRKLEFASNNSDISFVRVRSFDVATFVAYGAAHMGICGFDVLCEFSYSEIYSLHDLQIGLCRLSLAEIDDGQKLDFSKYSHLKVASKYPKLTADFFARKGIQAEIIKLNGAMELAPRLGMSRFIVDLVGTGATLKANNLAEREKIIDVSSRLIVNRTAYKTNNAIIKGIISDLL